MSLPKNQELTVRSLASQGANRWCLECNSLGTTYVNFFNYSYVCTRCSGLLREIHHRVKGITAANFSSQELMTLKFVGNDACKKVWFPNQHLEKTTHLTESELKSNIYNKYVLRKWLDERELQLQTERIHSLDKSPLLIDAPLSQPKKSSPNLVMGTTMEDQGIARVSFPPQNQTSSNFKSSPTLLDLTNSPATKDIEATSTTQQATLLSVDSPDGFGFSSRESKVESTSSRDSHIATLSEIFSTRDDTVSSIDIALPSLGLVSSATGNKLKTHLEDISLLEENFLNIERSLRTILATESNPSADRSYLISKFQTYESQVIHMNEKLMTIIMSLDSYTLEDHELNERSARKQLIVYIHSLHDRLDLCLKSLKHSLELHDPISNQS